MISTAETALLPDYRKLKNICKAMAVLDSILSPEWQYRYHSYNSVWAENEEFFEMRDGEGVQLLLLFLGDGAVLNGFISGQEPADKQKLFNLLPEKFHEFIYGEPVSSAGTTFCLWQTDGDPNWHTHQLAAALTASTVLLSPLDGFPDHYKQWADTYFESNGRTGSIPLETVSRIFGLQPLNRAMVLSLSPQFSEWEQLKEDLQEISYQYHF